MKTTQKSPLTNSRFGRMGWILIVYYFITLFFEVGFTGDGQQLYVPAISSSTGLSSSTLLYFVSIAGYIGIFAYIPLGIWAQKRSIRVQATILGLGAGFAFLGLGFVKNLPGFVICIVLLIVCSGGRGWISCAKLVSNWFPRKKGLVMGYTTIGNNFGTVALVPLMVFLIAKGGMRLTSVVIGIAIIATTVIFFFWLRDTPEECGLYPDNLTPEQEKEYQIPSVHALKENEKEEANKGIWTTAKILKTKEFWIISIACALAVCGCGASIAFSLTRLQEFGLSQNTATVINSLMAVLACFGSYVWGWIDQKYNTKKSYLIFCIMYLIGYLLNLGAAAWDHNLPLMFVSVFIFYWCLGGTANWPVSFCASLFGRHDFMKAQTPLMMVFTAGKSTTSAIIAFGMTLTAGTLTGSYMLGAMIYVVAIILILFLNIPKFVKKHPLT